MSCFSCKVKGNTDIDSDAYIDPENYPDACDLVYQAQYLDNPDKHYNVPNYINRDNSSYMLYNPIPCENNFDAVTLPFINGLNTDAKYMYDARCYFYAKKYSLTKDQQITLFSTDIKDKISSVMDNLFTQHEILLQIRLAPHKSSACPRYFDILEIIIDKLLGYATSDKEDFLTPANITGGLLSAVDTAMTIVALRWSVLASTDIKFEDSIDPLQPLIDKIFKLYTIFHEKDKACRCTLYMYIILTIVRHTLTIGLCWIPYYGGVILKPGSRNGVKTIAHFPITKSPTRIVTNGTKEHCVYIFRSSKIISMLVYMILCKYPHPRHFVGCQMINYQILLESANKGVGGGILASFRESIAALALLFCGDMVVNYKYDINECRELRHIAYRYVTNDNTTDFLRFASHTVLKLKYPDGNYAPEDGDYYPE